MLREGGNAVDAALCSVLTSCVTESPLTGLGAGGFMLIHRPGEAPSSVLVDFFVAAGGSDGVERGSELVPIDVDFGGTTQVFNVGAASCGVPGLPAGIEWASERYGSMPLAEMVKPGARLAHDGVVVNEQQAYLFEILAPILSHTPEGAEVYSPAGRPLVQGETFRWPDAGDALERFGDEGAEPFYGGEVGARVADWVRDRGGTLGQGDLAAYEPVEREPVAADFRGARVLTNPPPSSGGFLIAKALAALEGTGPESGVSELVEATEAANALRTEEFAEALHDPSRLGSTTHISALDADGMCVSVTCSNGTGSGLVVPGTGVHLNNMLGETDLNPGGFHRIPPGRRVSSMMAPTIALRDGRVELGLGSAGSNRIRSAILGVAVRVLEQGMDAAEAVNAPRIHFEDGVVQAEPGVDEEGLARVEARGIPVVRWDRPNLFFGGVQAVVRDSVTGDLSGAGDPRRGGAVAFA